MKSNFKRYFKVIIIILLLILSLKDTSYLTRNIKVYTNIFINNFYPSALIFYLLSSIIIEYQVIEEIIKLLKVNITKIYIIIISIITGTPGSTKILKEMFDKKIISEKNANELIMYTHFPNPLFVLTTVSIIVNSKKISHLILISIILSNIIIGLIMSKKKKINNNINISINNKNTFSKVLEISIFKTIKLIVLIYGISIFFYLISVLFSHYLNLNIYLDTIISGLFDLTNGVLKTVIIKDIKIRSLLIIIFISLAPISIHFQVKSIIDNSKILYRNFLLGRIFQCIISLSIYIILYKLFIS